MKNLKRGLISNEYPSLVTLSPIKELKVKCKNSTDFFAGASVSEDMCFTLELFKICDTFSLKKLKQSKEVWTSLI